MSSPVVDTVPESVSNASYSLNGSPVLSETITSVTFYDISLFGGFNLGFSGRDFLSLYGAQVFDGSGNLIPGSYPATIDADGLSGLPPASSGNGTVFIGAAAIPEPSSFVSGGIAAMALAGLGLRRCQVAARSINAVRSRGQ